MRRGVLAVLVFAAIAAPARADEVKFTVRDGATVHIARHLVKRDAEITYVGVNGRKVPFAETVGEVVYVYGHGLTLRFDSPKHWLRTTATNIGRRKAHVVVRYTPMTFN